MCYASIKGYFRKRMKINNVENILAFWTSEAADRVGRGVRTYLKLYTAWEELVLLWKGVLDAAPISHFL
jgi:hypothetical protein